MLIGAHFLCIEMNRRMWRKKIGKQKQFWTEWIVVFDKKQLNCYLSFDPNEKHSIAHGTVTILSLGMKNK